jgi:hypothetical protein
VPNVLSSVDPRRVLFSDALGYRTAGLVPRGQSENFSKLRWAHQLGGNYVDHQGAAVWLENRPSSNGAAMLWPSSTHVSDYRTVDSFILGINNN